MSHFRYALRDRIKHLERGHDLTRTVNSDRQSAIAHFTHATRKVFWGRSKAW